MAAESADHERNSLLPLSAANNNEPIVTNPMRSLSALLDCSLENEIELHLELNPKSEPTLKKPYMIRSENLRSTRPRGYVRWLYRWGWETGACVGSLAAFFATIGLLKTYDEKTQPEWPYGITINSAISWLTVMTKGFLLIPAAACTSQSMWIAFSAEVHNLTTLTTYDSASRGPWGAVQLLWTLRVRRLACLGAMIMLLAVGIDPTVQQAITIQTRPVPSMQLASIPRSQYFLRFLIDDEDNHLPTPAMMGAIYSGLFYSATISREKSLDVVPSCPTGNCTYPIFQSLAICSSCQNLTHAVKKTCSEYDLENLDRFNFCEFSLPNGLSINQTSGLSSIINIKNFHRDTITASSWLPPVEPTGNEDTLLNITILKGSTKSAEQNGDKMSYNATQCTLYWCINTYNSSVVNGQLVEKTLHSWNVPTAEWSLGYSGRPKFLSPPPISSNSAPTTFTLGYYAVGPLEDWLLDRLTFSNSYAVRETEYKNGSLTWAPDVSSNISVPGYVVPAVLDLIGLFQLNEPLEIFPNLAKSMTTLIRSTTDSEKTNENFAGLKIADEGPIIGVAYDLQVYIAIRWAWLAFAASLLVLMLLFFTLVIIESAKSDVAIWKSSPLALVFHGLNASSVEKLRGTTELAEMDARARQIEVRLRDTGSGVMLEDEKENVRTA